MSALNDIGGIVRQIIELDESHIAILEKVVANQIVYESEYGGLTVEQINALGDYHLQILRALQQVRKAANDFVHKHTTAEFFDHAESYV
jgi:hypothetical protein